MNQSQERVVGIVLPAFTPRREGDLGIGDTRAMSEWIEWAANHHVGFLQLLPINETGSDDSPYNAISSVALEPLYLAMEDVPGLSEEDIAVARKQLGTSLQSRLVDYPQVRSVKRELLRLSYPRFLTGDFASERGEFLRFQQEENTWLNDYVLFRWLMDRAGGSEAWDLWPEQFGKAALAREFYESESSLTGNTVAEELAFHAWVQWLCHRQWRAVRALADLKGVKLMGDVPIGISYHSADVFFQPGQFHLDWYGGAPPETMFKHDRFIQRWGQNWGIPLYDWELMEKQDFAWWKQRIRKLTEIFHIFRIDHILGFYRIYAFPWHPRHNPEFLDLTEAEAAERTGGRLPQWAWRADDTAENKAANCADGDRRLKAILAAAGSAEVVGEDLGCVPEYVRPHLESLGIAGFRIPHWDSRDGRVLTGSELPPCSFVTYATHDHDALAAMWEGFRLAALEPSGDPGEQEAGRWNLRMMAEFGGIDWEKEESLVYNERIQWKLIDGLLASRSKYAALMITDLYGMSDRFNKPGTVGGENWRFRLPFTLDHAYRDIALADRALRLRQSSREMGRAKISPGAAI